MYMHCGQSVGVVHVLRNHAREVREGRVTLSLSLGSLALALSLTRGRGPGVNQERGGKPEERRAPPDHLSNRDFEGPSPAYGRSDVATRQMGNQGKGHIPCWRIWGYNIIV